MRMLVSSSLRPRAGTGKALSQSDEFSEATAKSLALSAGIVWSLRRSLYFLLQMGRSQLACSAGIGGCGQLLFRVSSHFDVAASTSRYLSIDHSGSSAPTPAKAP